MEDEKDIEFYIPPNVDDNGGPLGLPISGRNLAEALIVAIFSLLLVQIVTLNSSILFRYMLRIIVVIPPTILFLVFNYRGCTLTQYLTEVLNYRKRRKKLQYKMPPIVICEEQKKVSKKEKRKQKREERLLEKKEEKNADELIGL